MIDIKVHALRLAVHKFLGKVVVTHVCVHRRFSKFVPEVPDQH